MAYGKVEAGIDLNILVIIGSTRPQRQGERVARWFLGAAQAQGGANFELADLRDWTLPDVERPYDASRDGEAVVARWAAKVAAADGYVVVTPEYNHGYPGALKNALDHVYREWNRKPMAFVSYGGMAGGSRAVQQLRLVAAELQMAPLRHAVVIARVRDAFDDAGQPADPSLAPQAANLVENLLWWAAALKAARAQAG